MSLLDVIEYQPHFPREDLTDNNAAYLGLALGNMVVLQGGHKVAEEYYSIFTGTHKPLVMASENLFDDTDAVKAINFGITALEALTAFVAAERPEPAIVELKDNITFLIKPVNSRSVEDYFGRAHQEFVHDAPRTARVIAEGSARLSYPPELAVFGGAIARRFELDNIED